MNKKQIYCEFLPKSYRIGKTTFPFFTGVSYRIDRSTVRFEVNYKSLTTKGKTMVGFCPTKLGWEVSIVSARIFKFVYTHILEKIKLEQTQADGLANFIIDNVTKYNNYNEYINAIILNTIEYCIENFKIKFNFIPLIDLYRLESDLTNTKLTRFPLLSESKKEQILSKLGDTKKFITLQSQINEDI